MDTMRRTVLSSEWTGAPPSLRHSVRGLLRKTARGNSLAVTYHRASRNDIPFPVFTVYNTYYAMFESMWRVLVKGCSISGYPPGPGAEVRVKWIRGFELKNAPNRDRRS